MLFVLADVVAPTVSIFTNLLNWYLFLGFSAGTIVTIWMVYNIVMNREKKGVVKPAPNFHDKENEESPWGDWKTVILTLLVTGSVLAFVEYQTFASTGLITTPTNTDPYNISVTGQQFVWSFTYPNGYTNIRNLVVPVDTVVQLNITSKDVDHSFSIQTEDVARDALPGEYDTVWFNATQTGTFVNDIRCKELCGVGHATMIGNFTVLSQSAFAAWLASTTPSTVTTSTGPPTGPTYQIIIPNGIGTDTSLNFEPASVSVAPGTTIIFVDQDTSTHNIYFTSVPSGATISPNPSPNTPSWTNNEFYVTLTVPGTYDYICQYHSWMKGTIVVT